MSEYKEYLESKGWTAVPRQVSANSRITLVFWRDPLRPLRELWKHEAMYVQKSRESLVRRIMGS